ncbi:nucleoside-diphosphate sugar epimerase [Legionella birminghamensis]|uniref:Nucleoside-diphosphate sugar epimerase n=1 Tax=Legionella birminghamensis TaxID=28083 RepID=A0A378ICJ9_9GAMM|nr:TIGR01777 family oxidoreductase [Legionella birminghamensis]KTC71687.1 nucleoside-diphosphate sugar epimerase [Legionella birminghamensis]STX32475.1 nucleoside-diphosphate sugar epimerase [Legionella birminghamensis]
MNILIAGASGLIGRKLVKALVADHQISVLGRNIKLLQAIFSDPVKQLDWDHLDTIDPRSFDAVINLSGRNISSLRWNNTIKQDIINSRVHTNKVLIDWLLKHQASPHFFCANAVGIYGTQADNDSNAFDENSAIDDETPHDFLSKVGILWEQSLQLAIDANIPVTITRFGVVLDREGGMLGKLAPVFKLGIGSILGKGQQIISWVDMQDVIGAYQFLLANPGLTGPLNVCAPEPVTQEIFARTLARVLKRPLLFRIPGWVIKLLFGEMGECLLLSGQRVLPNRLMDNGYQFQYPDLEDALEHQFANTEPRQHTKSGL